MAELVSLREAVQSLVRDGDVVALEGFTHLIPHAPGHELVRQGRRDLALVRMTPDVIYDRLIGMGCARKLVFSLEEIGEVPLQTAIYCGVPAANSAFAIARRVLDEED
jgi:acyl CoA:acetate/3-ketoacid CoA transferase alpha subunit